MLAASTSAAPRPAGAYAIEISVQGFEKRYVDMACNVLDDLLMLAFAPKSLSALPTGSPSPSDAPLALALGATSRRDVRLPWRRTRFTLLRSPHIDKQGMEQFERREYKTVLSAATNSDAELRRLLEAVKIYQFTGVQIRIDVTSAQRLELPTDVRRLLAGGAAAAPPPPPPPPAGGEAAGRQVLGSPAVTLPAPRSPEALFREELGAVLRVLRPLVWAGLAARRAAMDAVPEFTAWRLRTAAAAAAAAAGGQRPAPPVASAAAEAGVEEEEGGGGDAYGRLLRQRMQQQLELMRAPAEAEAGADSQPAAAAYGLDPAVAAELLARIDAELLNAHEAALQGQPPPPPSDASDGAAAAAAAADAAAAWAARPTALDASKMTPAEYAYAVLKYAQYVDALYDAAGRGGADADAALQLSSPGLALRLLQLWCSATSAEFKQALGLPPAEVEKQILEERLRREEMARAAAALEAKPPAAAAPSPPPPQAAAATAAADAAQGQGRAQGQRQRPSDRPGQGQYRREGQQGGGGQDGAGGFRGRGQQQQQQPRRGPGGSGQPAGGDR
ncbi:hypothetical protein PLESTF_001658900 [Pleodorina starrii]|nr:hypothetical protein PLESTF_001658900 [Pleodorina starrii]